MSAAIASHFTLVNVAVWLSWKPERHLLPRQALCTMCLRRQGVGGLLWRAATLGEPQGLVFVLTSPPMAAYSPAAGEENEKSKLSCPWEKNDKKEKIQCLSWNSADKVGFVDYKSVSRRQARSVRQDGSLLFPWLIEIFHSSWTRSIPREPFYVFLFSACIFSGLLQHHHTIPTLFCRSSIPTIFPALLVICLLI